MSWVVTQLRFQLVQGWQSQEWYLQDGVLQLMARLCQVHILLDPL